MTDGDAYSERKRSAEALRTERSAPSHETTRWARKRWRGLLDWRAERFPLQRFVPLALLLGWAASIGAGTDPGDVPIRALAAFTLLLQFRLWDDLADVGRDRTEHPGRLLARSDGLEVFAVAVALLGVMHMFVLTAVSGVHAAIGFAVLNVGVAAWYRWHMQRGLLHLHVLLLKYPAFVLLLGAATPTGREILSAAAALYVALCLFELFDDADRLGPPRTAATLHALVLCALAFGSEVDVRGTIFAALVALLIAAAVPEGLCARRCGPAVSFLPFFAAIAVLVRLSLGGSS